LAANVFTQRLCPTRPTKRKLCAKQQARRLAKPRHLMCCWEKLWLAIPPRLGLSRGVGIQLLKSQSKDGYPPKTAGMTTLDGKHKK
jgi:hypothetical protein